MTVFFYFAPSALYTNGLLTPGALPQAVTFRAFGAETAKSRDGLFKR